MSDHNSRSIDHIKPRIDKDDVEVSFIQDGASLRVFIDGEEWFTSESARRVAEERDRLRGGIQRVLEHCTTFDQLEAALYDLIEDGEEE